MAYFIFLNSLRSLGEFRKNPHVKIPPKSPCTNFQSLGIFKNQILFGKDFSRHFRPSRGPFSFLFNRPFSPLPIGPQPHGRPSSPHGPTADFFLFTAPAERRRHSRGAKTHPPLVQDPPPSTIKPQPLPSFNWSFTTLKSPFTPPPVSPLMPAIIAARHPPRASIKGEPSPRSTPHHSPSPSPPLPHRNTPPTELCRRHQFTLVARPLRRSLSSGEPRGESPIPPFPFPAAVGEHRHAGAPSRALSGDFPVRSTMWVHRGPARSIGPRSVDRVHGFFPLRNKSEKSKFNIS
jgi:hypothetical protein